MIDKCDPNIASWTKHGDMFQIQDRKEFETRILPSYFGNKKFSSFTRQLNFYGFQKMQSTPNKNAAFDAEIAKHLTFYHRYFQRGKMDLLINIRKQTIKKEKKNGSCNSGDSKEMKKEPNNGVSASTSGSSSIDQRSQIDTLKKRVESLEKAVEKLQSMIFGQQNQEQIVFHGSHNPLMKVGTSLCTSLCSGNNESKDYHQLEKVKHHESNTVTTLEPREFQDHDTKKNSNKRVYSDDYLAHYFSDHIERQVTISSKLSLSSFFSNDNSIFCNSEPLPFMEKEPTPKRRKSISGSRFNEATYDVYELPANSLKTPVDQSKPTLPPHPKSKNHLPNDIQYMQIPIVSTDRIESFNSLSSNASFSQMDPSSVFGTETSLSSFMSTRLDFDFDSLTSCTILNK